MTATAAGGPTGPPPPPTVVAARHLADWTRASRLELDPGGAPATPVVFVDFDAGPAADVPLADQVPAGGVVAIGLTAGALPAPSASLARALACTLTVDPTVALTASDSLDQTLVPVPDLDTAMRELHAAVRQAPRAAATLVDLLRITASATVADGLVAESLAYSMLLAGPEFARWRAERPQRTPAEEPAEPAVLVTRDAATLTLTLNRPRRHNAFSRHVRDGLADGLDLALLDASVERIVLAGRGGSFCSGGDLDEFGSAHDVALAHLVRLDRSVARRVAQCRERVEANLHGACIGAGIEIPSFARHVVAAEDAYFRLPEVAMGLVPGAGGTVGITARIGRWRTAYLALSGTVVDSRRAAAWGLVDARC